MHAPLFFYLKVSFSLTENLRIKKVHLNMIKNLKNINYKEGLNSYEFVSLNISDLQQAGRRGKDIGD